MEIINDCLQIYAHDKIAEKYETKLLFSVKKYLSRACSTARDPKVIQLNHYIDEFYSAKKSNYKNVVLSPSQVPFPIAYYVNISLISNEKSKLFFVNKKNEIEVHPYEYIIPAFIALFSGENLTTNCKATGNLFYSCIILCGELAMKLINHQKFSSYDSICIAIVVIVASVWNFSRQSLGYVVDNILSTGRDLDIRVCLEHVSVAGCSPNWFTLSYVLSSKTENLLSFAIQEISSIKTDFPGLEELRFCLPNMDPFESLLASELYNNCSDTVKIVVNKTCFDKKCDQMENSLSNCRKHLSRFITWNRTDNDPRSNLLRFPVDEDMLEAVSIELADSSSCTTSVLLSLKNQAAKEFTLSKMASQLAQLDHLLMPHLECNLQVIIGVSATDIVMNNINSMFSLSCPVVEALSMIFERPGLD